MTIPAHLENLPVWRGLPVPYINCWGDEADQHAWSIRYDEHVGQNAWFTGGVAGEGDAFLAQQCLQRQREVAVRGLCQVCHRVISGERWLLVWGRSADVARAGGPDTPAVSEPWLCSRCVPYVLSICPGVRAHARDETLAVLRVVEHKILISTGWHDDHGTDVVAAMWAKIVPLDADVLDPTEALAVFA